MPAQTTKNIQSVQDKLPFILIKKFWHVKDFMKLILQQELQ